MRYDCTLGPSNRQTIDDRRQATADRRRAANGERRAGVCAYHPTAFISALMYPSAYARPMWPQRLSPTIPGVWSGIMA